MKVMEIKFDLEWKVVNRICDSGANIFEDLEGCSRVFASISKKPSAEETELEEARESPIFHSVHETLSAGVG